MARPKPPRVEVYRARLAAIRPYVKVGIPGGQRYFTGAQKAVITRLYNKHQSSIRAVARNEATFVPLKGSKLRTVGKGNYAKASKGVFIKGDIEKTRVVGKGQKARIEITYAGERGKRRQDIYFNAPPTVIGNPDAFAEWAFYKVKETGATSLAYNVRGQPMSRSFDVSAYYDYYDYDEYLDDYDDDIATEYAIHAWAGAPSVATGITAIYRV